MNTLVNKTNIKIMGVTIAVGAVLSIGMPAQARYDFWNNQPQPGAIHQKENRIEARLQRDYNRGMIDSNEFAQMQRDLDGITVQEDEFRVDHNGLGANDQKCIQSKLNQFQQDLSRAEADKGETVLVAR